MTPDTLSRYSDEWFLSLYLMYGSVEETVRSYPDTLPISIANYHRLVKKYGLIKSAGRHVSLPETLHFFREKAMAPGAPLESIYRQMPLSFKTSMSTLHRIYQYIEKQAVRRHAAALVITSEEDKHSVLVGQEVFGNSRYGKRVGDFSIPMSFAKETESHFDSALRVLQQEVFSSHAQRGELGAQSNLVSSIIKKDIEPFSYFDIVDVRVKMFDIVLPNCLSGFSSYKLVNHRMLNINDLPENQTRAGIKEMLDIYTDHLYVRNSLSPQYYISSINSLLTAEA